jgi:dipeptidyl aminopeptidase/acylaminoacyl peptidase
MMIVMTFSFALTGAAQTPRPMNFDDVMALKTVNNAALSPDGKQVVYVVGYADLKENERRSELWTVNVDTAKPRRFTTGKNDTAPQWSPDGQTIAFISTRGVGEAAKPQIYLIPAFGGEAEKLTDSKTGVSGFAWSPDGKRIAFIAAMPLTEAEEKKIKDKDDPQIYDSNFRYNRLYVIEIETKKTTELTRGELSVSDPQWSPDGKRLSVTGHPTPKADDGSYGDIYVLNADGNDLPRKLFVNDGPDSNAAWSPDGKWIACNSGNRQSGFAGYARVNVVASEGGQPRVVAPSFDFVASNITWTRDGSQLILQVSQRTTTQLYRVAVAGGDARQISNGDGVISSASFSADTARVAFTHEDMQHASEVYVATVGSFSPLKLTEHQTHFNKLALGKSEVIKWESKDGLEIEGLLLYPANYEAGKRYPLLAWIHGGPSGVWNQSFKAASNNFGQIWSGKGWFVFYPNPRGSSSYGEKFVTANVNDWGIGDYQDIQTGIDALIARGLVDSEKMGQSGWSYGGYMTAWTLTQTNRFKAVMVGAGLSNNFSMYGTNDIPRYLEGYFNGTAYDNVEAYWTRSAMAHIKKAKTPTLILHGGNDQRVPIGQAQELYLGLKKNNVPVSLVFYPREGHGLLEPRHQLDRMKRETAWFLKYVLGVEETTASTGN